MARSISGSGALGIFQGGASASFHSRLTHIVGGRQITIACRSRSGDFHFNSEDWQSVVKAIDGFAATVNENNAYLTRLWSSGYEVADGVDGLLAQQVQELARKQAERLDDLGRVYGRLREQQRVVTYVIANSERFADHDVARCEARRDELNDLAIVYLRAKDAISDNFEANPAVPPLGTFEQPKPTVAAPPVVMAGAPVVRLYTGPSCTGTMFEVRAPGDNLPADLEDKVRSFEIVGDFKPNRWWITLYEHPGQQVAMQTFTAPNVFNLFDRTENGKLRRFEEFDITQGKKRERILYLGLNRTSSVRIFENEQTDQLPPPSLGQDPPDMDLSGLGPISNKT